MHFSPHNQIGLFLLSLRPVQRIKNSILFLPLIFSGTFFFADKLIAVVYIFLLFSVFVGATYVRNDYKDVEKDRLHPVKSKRPLASGKLHVKFALGLSIFILVSIPVLVYYLYGAELSCLFLIYFIYTFFYTLRIKHIVILDVFSIAIGFVIRGVIGSVAVGVVLSPRFLTVLFFGAVCLGFLKRYQELKLGIHTRKVITQYNEKFLEQIIGMSTTTLLIVYALYTFNSTQSQRMIVTLPIAAFILVRYYYNIFVLEKYKEGIESIILRDKWILLAGTLYIVMVMLIIRLE